MVCRWVLHPEGGIARTVAFTQPRAGMQTVDVPCRQEYRLMVYGDGVLVINTTQTQYESPFCDAYCVRSFWKASGAAGGMLHVEEC